MKYHEILEILAPCGLNCKKCMAHVSGDIKHFSSMLQKSLGSFDSYAERFSKFWPEFKAYPQFKTLLDYFTKGNCAGCRKGDCKYPNCGVAACYKNKGVDFCFQCSEFPCDKTNFDENLKSRWMKMNSRMKEIGVEPYYDEIKNDPRYV